MIIHETNGKIIVGRIFTPELTIPEDCEKYGEDDEIITVVEPQKNEQENENEIPNKVNERIGIICKIKKDIKEWTWGENLRKFELIVDL